MLTDARAIRRDMADAAPDLAETEFTSLADLDARPHTGAFGPGEPRTVAPRARTDATVLVVLSPVAGREEGA